MWAVPCGVIGARLYHVATDWSAFSGAPRATSRCIQQGGLGIYGALLGGALGAVDRRAPGGRSAARDARLRGARRGARAGARPLRQLLQPGALRRPDEPAVGARDRPEHRPAQYLDDADVPPDVPLRVALEPARDGGAAARRAALAPPGRRLRARALPRAVFARALLRRGPARRSGPRDRAVAAQPGGRGRRLRARARRTRAPASAAAAGGRRDAA